MPSDDLSSRLLRALSGNWERFHSAVVAAAEEVRAYVEARDLREGDLTGTIAGQLGPFADRRIDPERFAALFSGTPDPSDRLSLVRLRWALGTLNEFARAPQNLLAATLQPGLDLRTLVGAAFARIGKAFGAAQTVERIRSGRYRFGRDEGLLDDFPFARWNRAERQIAPPLVVELQGRDLQAGGLAEFLDGQVKIALVVRGECAPAPLVRLITPGTLVMQTTDEAEMSLLATTEGPGIAALVPEEAARFVHRPTGATLRDRLRVDHLPAREIRTALNGQSAFQQMEELAQLVVLAEGIRQPAAEPAPEPAPEPAAEPAPPSAGDEVSRSVDLLAGWLLRQADQGAGAG